ncbi:fimbrial protein [Salmonella enterica]|nr:fimbrial protein [Salmonella enterica]
MSGQMTYLKTTLMTYLKTTLMVLAMMAGAAALPVQAVGSDESYCNVTDGFLPFTSINLRAGKYSENDTIKDFDFTIKYTCRTFVGSYNYGWFQPTLITSTAFKNGVALLYKAGLALELHIQEDPSPSNPGGPPAVDMNWNEIKGDGGGTIIKKPFGALLPVPDSKNPNPIDTPRTARLWGKIYVDRAFTNTAIVVDIPGQTALEIVPLNIERPFTHKTGVTIPSFSIRILPDNLGTVKITPSPVVDFGRIYATSLDTLTKTSPPFTVTATQTNGSTVTFKVPLNIEFDTGGQTLTDNDQAIKLRNRTTQEENGLKLSITDTGTGEKVTFNKAVPMGERSLSFGPNISDSISQQYTAKVEPVSNKPDIKTGTFNAGVTVKVTYN